MLVKPVRSIHILACLAAAASLVACTYPAGGPHHGQPHAGQSANTAVPGSSGASPAQGGMMGASKGGWSGGMQQMDMEAMCAMYRSMRDAPSEQARQAMMERHMPNMSPEMRLHHMEMLRQHCR